MPVVLPTITCRISGLYIINSFLPSKCMAYVRVNAMHVCKILLPYYGMSVTPLPYYFCTSNNLENSFICI